MKIENIILIGLLILVIGGLIYSLGGFGFFKAGPSKESKTAVKSNVINPIQSESNKKVSESSVSIDLALKEFKNGNMYFDIGVNTHSVDLSPFDLASLTVLEFEGSSIKPSSAPKLSGHHNSGTLIFNTGKELKKFKIRIKGIPDIEERFFEWS